MTWCTYQQSFEKIQHCVFSSSAKTKRDGQTDGRGGGGGCNISRPGPTAPAGDNKDITREKVTTSFSCDFFCIFGYSGAGGHK